MNPALTIAKKEYSLSLRSFGTYIIFGVFLLASGIWFALTALKLQVADLRDIFSKMHSFFLFFIPALTMGSIARERASGTLELISTLPIKLSHIVWGKFLSVWLQVATVLAFTLVFPILVVIFGVGMDLGAVFTGYLGLLCAAAAFAGIGIFASSLTDNQVIGFVIALAISGLMFLLGRLGDLIPLRLFAAIEYLGFDYHLNSFMKGVIDTRDLLWFAVVTFIFVLLAQLRLQSENLRQER
ncbi:MAG: ABC transporter permease [Candidatus Cloacimonadaceae bacterium]|jgi:ABC-2 type transport system permease protein|nr:ABC transporter permease [Candidatus Cloacimonadota bacterium]MDX9949829.1 ABC transporter permease [Candidatus Syntrophosphaera sp.]NLN85406.1 ABC transporter permease [Candidatus Cloacimonadota bacterium]